MSTNRQFYFILDGHEPVPCDDLVKFSKWFHHDGLKNRLVAKTVYGKLSNHKIIVSTVFLGIDHSPCSNQERELFETMVFGGDKDGLVQRYATWDEAKLGHQKILSMLEGVCKRT